MYRNEYQVSYLIGETGLAGAVGVSLLSSLFLFMLLSGENEYFDEQ